MVNPALIKVGDTLVYKGDELTSKVWWLKRDKEFIVYHNEHIGTHILSYCGASTFRLPLDNQKFNVADFIHIPYSKVEMIRDKQTVSMATTKAGDYTSIEIVGIIDDEKFKRIMNAVYTDN